MDTPTDRNLGCHIRARRFFHIFRLASESQITMTAAVEAQLSGPLLLAFIICKTDSRWSTCPIAWVSVGVGCCLGVSVAASGACVGSSVGGGRSIACVRVTVGVGSIVSFTLALLFVSVVAWWVDSVGVGFASVSVSGVIGCCLVCVGLCRLPQL